MDTKEVVIVTGMSGAGKTCAMAVFENLQFSCIDNYPVALLNAFGQLLKTGTQYQKVAMAVEIENAMEAVRVLSNMDWISLTVVYLECSDEMLIQRYKATRRSHPLLIANQVSSLSEAIQIERSIASPVSQLANIFLDTTTLTLARFQDFLEQHFYHGSSNAFRVSFISFGYKYGIPKDVDLLFDVRFLPNPFYIDTLRNQSGNDKPVYNYVMSKDETQEYIKRLVPFLDYSLQKYEQEGRMHLAIGIGCTGGQHRSVSIANYLTEKYRYIYQVRSLHRDIRTDESIVF